MGLSTNGAEDQVAALTDEELAGLVRAHGRRHPAAAELMLRYHAWVARRVRGLGRGRCRPEDLADAGQQGLLALLEAAEAYDPARAGNRPGSFRTLLATVLRLRFENFLRGRWRAERKLDRTVGLEEALARGPDARRTGPDPAAPLEAGELHEQLRQAVAQLPPASRTLLEHILAGASLHEAAARLGLSYQQAKRLRRAALATLKTRLQDWAP